MSAVDELESALRDLWPSANPWLIDLLPRDLESLRDFYPRLQHYVTTAPRSIAGTVDPAAIVRGDIIALGQGSVIEAGAVIHDTCRLILGAGCRVRAGALLRDEVVIGDRCMIGAHSEVARSVIGHDTALGHSIVFNDSIAGSNVLVSAYIATGNAHLTAGKEIEVRTRSGRVSTGRTYLGSLLGDGVRLGSNVTLSPGTIVMPGLSIPAAAVLIGIIDAQRRDNLMRDFFERWGGGE